MAFEDDYFDVDPDQVEAIVELPAPTRPKRKTPSKQPVSSLPPQGIGEQGKGLRLPVNPLYDTTFGPLGQKQTFGDIKTRMDLRKQQMAREAKPPVYEMRPPTSNERKQEEQLSIAEQSGAGPALYRGFIGSIGSTGQMLAGGAKALGDVLQTQPEYSGVPSLGRFFSDVGDWLGTSGDIAAYTSSVKPEGGTTTAEDILQFAAGVPALVAQYEGLKAAKLGPAAIMAVMRASRARGAGQTDPLELAKEAAQGFVEGQLFKGATTLESPLLRAGAVGAVGAGGAAIESAKRGEEYPSLGELATGAGSALALYGGLGGRGAFDRLPNRAARLQENEAQAARNMREAQEREKPGSTLFLGEESVTPPTPSTPDVTPPKPQTDSMLASRRPTSLMDDRIFAAEGQLIRAKLLFSDQLNSRKTEEARGTAATINNLEAEVERLKSLADQAKDLQNTYQFVPAPDEGGGSPYLIVPNWVAAAVATRGGTSGPGGITFSNASLEEVRQDVIRYSPDPQTGADAANAIVNAMREANKLGLSALSVVNRDTILLGEADTTAPHESIHVGQYTAGRPSQLHDQEWAKTNPDIRRLLDNKEERAKYKVDKYLTPEISPENLLAVELPAYVMSGDSNLFFDDPSKGVGFVMGYLSSVLDKSGVDALNSIEQAAILPPEKQNLIPIVRSMYAERITEDIATGKISQQKGNWLLESLDPSKKSTAATRAGSTEGTGAQPSEGIRLTTGGPGEGGQFVSTSGGVSPDLRQYNIDRFVEDSTVKVPVYRGTNSVRPEVINFETSGDIGIHFGGDVETADRRLRDIAKPVDIFAYPPGEAPSALDSTYGPNALIGSYYIDLKNPLRVPDIFTTSESVVYYLVKNGNLELTPALSDNLSKINKDPNAKKAVQQEVYRQLEGKGYDGFVYQNAEEGNYSDSYVVFRPNQIKSATGNVGTFDPSEPSMFLSKKGTPDPVNVGDKVKVKGYANQAEVVEVFSDGGVKVRFPDGTEDEFDGDKVYPVGKTAPPSGQTTQTPPAQSGQTNTQIVLSNIAQQANITPKPYVPPKKGVVPTLPGRMRIRKTPLWVDRIGPGDTPGTVRIQFGDGTVAQFDLDDVRDASGKKIKDPMVYMLTEDPPSPPIPPPSKPIDPSLPGGIPDLFTQGVTITYNRVLAKRFTELLNNNNVNYDYSKSPMVQVYESLVDGKLRDQDVGDILQDEGLTWEEFAEDVYNTYSRAGSTLQLLSEITQRQWARLKRENPALFQKLVSPSRQINLILDDLNDTILGMSLWKRAGRLFQKAMLTQYVTAINNFMTATGRVPIDATAAGLGQAIRVAVQSKGGSWPDKMERARKSGYETFMTGFEAWRAMNPTQVQDVLQGRMGSNYAKNEEIVTEIEKYFPDIHEKLFAKPLEINVKELEEAENKIAGMKLLLPKVENSSKRRDLLTRINKLERAVNRENSILVKGGYRLPEAVFDFFLRPLQFGEFMLRRPQFVGRLSLELKDRGIDMNQVLRNTHLPPDQLASLPEDQRMTFKDLPEEAVKAALSSALEFTMALEPETGPEARLTERMASSMIKGINSLGPLVVLTDIAFPKAVFSAAKTFYDYSPLPFMFEWAENGSFSRIKNDVFGKGMISDPKTGQSFRPNPSTRGDYERLGRALVGTFMYALALGLIRIGLIGDDWYQLKTGTKDEKGNPIYLDMRKYIPHSRIFQLANLVDRFATNRVNDVQAGVELTDIALGMKKYSGDLDLVDTVDALAEYWAGPERNPFKVDKVNQTFGKYPATLLTPFLNLRSIVAAYEEDENVRKDLRGYGFWGPSMDRIPWLRRSIPDLNYPTFEGRMPLSQSPLLQMGSFQFAASPMFIGREFQRMGINIREYLPKDQDPTIDRTQNMIFSYLANFYGQKFENDPNYRNASDIEKAAIWEGYLMGPRGIATIAKEEALKANPVEAARRQVIKDVPGRFTRKAMGLTDYLEMLRK